MTIKTPLVTMLALVVAVSALAGDKKKHSDRAMIEKMEAFPCGAKENGVTGLGSPFGSLGVEHVNSDEKLCPQYLLRTDDMEYQVRPLDHKHPALLPVGKEGEFKISKDVLEMRIPDGDHKKRQYQVVGMKPIDHSETSEPQSSRYGPPRRDYPDRPLAEKNYADKVAPKPTDQPVPPPQ
jgi:hypothetical protein